MGTTDLQELVASALAISWTMSLVCVAASGACAWRIRRHALAADGLPAGSAARATARGKVGSWHQLSIPIRLCSALFIAATVCGHLLHDTL